MPRNGRGAYFDSSRSGAWPWSCIANARSYRPVSSVTIIPPSPQVIVLYSLKLYVPAIPNEPTLLPLYDAPNAWAQSSMSAMPCLSAIALSSSIRATPPSMWTTRIAAVRGVIFASTSAGSRSKVWSISARTGVAPV